MPLVSYVLANTKHGALLVNRFDYAHDRAGGLIGVGHQLLANSVFEPGEVQLLQRLISLLRESRGPGLVALDIGANIGVMSIELAKTMEGWGKVVAFEAQERVYYALCGNLTLTNSFNAQALNMAVSDSHGTLTIPRMDPAKPASFGSLELEKLERTEDVGQPVDYSTGDKVQKTTIDSLEFDNVALIKLDVEGMELKALAGMRQTIEKWRPVLTVEFIKGDYNKLNEFLKSCGYWTKALRADIIAVHADDPALSSIKSILD